MQRHRKQHNPINAAALARWIVLTSFVAVCGLIYVYQSVQLHTLGDRKKALEIELVNTRGEIEVTTGQVATLTSRAALERRLKEGYLRMVPIAEMNIVRINAPTGPFGGDAIQPVSNPGVGR
ncbi:MAG: hypothetical protein H0V56_03805 [Chthoniobacterales bacterium]|nr:hypothetical protein [Chthoniobacterales bacterium]